MPERVTVIGGGLAGSEAAFQLAVRGIPTTLVEMRPHTASPAHHSGNLAELVCANSLKSDQPETAPGMLKTELTELGSLILACARATAVPAGGALAVDRERFSALVTGTLESLPDLAILREEAERLPDGPAIIATGPLTSGGLESALSRLIGSDRLAFFDAAAPILDADSLNLSVCFAQSRYGKGEGADYLNCPLSPQQYECFIDELVAAERVIPHDFETRDLFQACQPVEEIARRGRDALRFGALKPVGIIDPATGNRPWAVVQLRAENRERTAYNLVGFQTNLTFPAQDRVFRSIPGLEQATFCRHGVMHRNTFVDAPRLLRSDLALREHPQIRVAGQLAGTEGYLEAAAGGLVAALGLVRELVSAHRTPPLEIPRDTTLGALLRYATDAETVDYQPMHVNFGLMRPLDPPIRSKSARHAAYAARSREAMRAWLATNSDELSVSHVRRRLASLSEHSS